MNYCKLWDIECNGADENGNCTHNRVTESGMFIVGELFCESEEFWHAYVTKRPIKDINKEFRENLYNALIKQGNNS